MQADVDNAIGLTRAQGSGRTQRGFSAIEVVVALALASILLAMGVTGFRLAVNRETIDGWARGMTYDIAFGRRAAITDRTTVSVTLTARSYTVAVNGGSTLRSAVLPSDISITTTCPTNVCSFGRQGIPGATGTITLTSASTGRSYVITIQGGTGRVSYH